MTPVARRILVQHGEFGPRAALREALREAYATQGFPVGVTLPGHDDDAVDARNGEAVPREFVLGGQEALDDRIAALRAELVRLEKQSAM